MLITNAGETIDLKEDAATTKSPSYQFATQNSAIIRNYIARTVIQSEEARGAVNRCLLGYSRRQLDTSSGSDRYYIKRALPHRYPLPAVLFTDLLTHGQFYASSIPSMTPEGRTIGITAPDSLAAWPAYRVQCRYEPKLYSLKEDADMVAEQGPLSDIVAGDALPDEGDALRRGLQYTRFIIADVKPASRVVTVPGGVFRFVHINVDLRGDIPGGFPYTQTRRQVNYTQISVPLDAVPWQAFRACDACVNEVEFDGYPADTMLYQGTDVQQETDHLGWPVANLTHRFLVVINRCPTQGLIRGWMGLPRVRAATLFIDPISVTGDPATADNENQRPYKRNDFGSLFRPDQPP